MSDEERPSPVQNPLRTTPRRALTPEHRQHIGEQRRAYSAVKDCVRNALDKLGNESFFIRLGNGSAEDRRCFAMIAAKLIPQEIAGGLDATLVVKVIKQLDDGSERVIEVKDG